MPKPEIFITFGVSAQEKKLLLEYCEQECRNQTDVLPLIRKLSKSINKGFPRNKLSQKTNHRDAENTETEERLRGFSRQFWNIFLFGSP
jgi:hypothetical protein